MNAKLFLAASIGVVLSVLTALNAIKFCSIKNNAAAADVEKLSNHEENKFEVVPIVEGAVGPESFAFDPLGGGPYTGVSDGRIIKWDQKINTTGSTSLDRCEGSNEHDKTEHICGRPLGLCFNQTSGDLYIADAYMGLLIVGPQGGLATEVVTHAHGIPFGFTNALDIDQELGAVYFTDSSSQYQERNYISVILSGDKTGRLMKYDPESKQAQVLLENLSFPNGMALSKNGDFILLAETTHCRIMRYWLKTPKAGTFQVFAQLPGFPDNIRRSPRGGFWVGIHSRRLWILKLVLSYPSLGNALLKLPLDITKAYSYMAKWTGRGLIIRLSEQGVILEMLEDTSGNRWKSISEVVEKDETLWIGSVKMPFAGKYKI
ncbi:protein STRICTOSIDINE SYNTHASE-LIKE 2 [Prunus yedoensis var. nudiflora]|uniref:Protein STRICTOSIDINE SYNTHASE-LIKE 2 n=1 Tax=Prunus yedoensis var. nudiflora TaxID=2094558 RepID=A0A314XJK2_PRUYE|nr:protein STRICTOSIDINE SYNTHASE-LIKE 2 [Prunus yedoensis var. nudiflora]